MLFKGVLIARASGRLGDSVWAHNRGGPYVRQLGNPNPNPATDAQARARDAYKSCIAAWAGLTPGQRNGWARLSEASPEFGRAGAVRCVGAFPAFVRANQPRIMVDAALGTTLGVIENAPDSPFAPFNPDGYSLLWAPDTGKLHLSFDGHPDWQQPPEGSALVVWSSPPLTATRRFYKSPMLLVGAASTSFDSGNSIGEAATGTTDQHVRCRLRVLMWDGRVSPEVWLDAQTDA